MSQKSAVPILLALLLATISPGLLGDEKLELPTRQVLTLEVSKAIAMFQRVRISF